MHILLMFPAFILLSVAAGAGAGEDTFNALPASPRALWPPISSLPIAATHSLTLTVKPCQSLQTFLRKAFGSPT